VTRRIGAARSIGAAAIRRPATIRGVALRRDRHIGC